MKKVIVFVLLCVFLAGCTRDRVELGIARDTLFSVEKSRSGVYGVFLTHDESVVYCTGDKDLGQEALSLIEHHGEVILEFKSTDVWKDTEGEFLGFSECQSYFNGESGFSEVILLSIEPVPARTGG